LHSLQNIVNQRHIHLRLRIRALAELIEERLIAEIENMSDEEAELLLAKLD